MKRLERLLTAGVLGLVILVAIAAQVGWFNPVAATGALFGAATGIEVPALDDPAMIRRGAGHYDRVCAKCHASPDRPEQAETLELTPPPPKLHLRAGDLPPEVLFATIKHGIDNTAMPAWPTQHRDDEIWDMVAFLAVLPSLDAPAYRQVAGLDVTLDAVPPVAQACVRCHGTDGRGTPDGAFPRLDIQQDSYLASALHAFREGTRTSGFMQSVASPLHDDEIAALAAYFQSKALSAEAPTRSQLVLDETKRRVPACAGCHGDAVVVRSEFPVLRGQYEPYLLRQLELFAEGRRGGGTFAPLMHAVASNLTTDDMEAAAEWFSSSDSQSRE